jgi:hypothetical protein
MNQKIQNEINEEKDYQEKRFLYEEQTKEINKIGDKLTARVFYITTFLFVIYLHSFGELLKIEKSIHYSVKIFSMLGFTLCFASIATMFLSFWHSQNNTQLLNIVTFSIFKNSDIENSIFEEFLKFQKMQTRLAIAYLWLTVLSGFFYSVSVIIIYLSL